jgi:hypothetical protein
MYTFFLCNNFVDVFVLFSHIILVVKWACVYEMHIGKRLSSFPIKMELYVLDMDVTASLQQ